MSSPGIRQKNTGQAAAFLNADSSSAFCAVRKLPGGEPCTPLAVWFHTDAPVCHFPEEPVASPQQARHLCFLHSPHDRVSAVEVVLLSPIAPARRFLVTRAG